jgi:hypothetical protein
MAYAIFSNDEANVFTELLSVSMDLAISRDDSTYIWADSCNLLTLLSR